MSIFFENDQLVVYNDNTYNFIQSIPDNSIDCVVTSPPYWNLRQYGDNPNEIGREETYEEYLNNLTDIFKHIYRILKPTGTCWVNISDTYLLNKSLAQIPERFALRMTDLGFIKRNTIIWQKANCIPTCAQNRFTPDFEYVYFFTKSETSYNFNMLYEPISETYRKDKRPHGILRNKTYQNSKYVQNKVLPYQKQINVKKEFVDSTENSLFEDNCQVVKPREDRYMRCVWRIVSKPSKLEHTAIFPKELATRCIKAGSNEGDTVLDPFAGSGTTLEVAIALKRKAIGIEIEKKYCKTILKRTDYLINNLFSDAANN